MTGSSEAEQPEQVPFLCMAWATHIDHGKIRVHHWHWPRRDIVNCRRLADLIRAHEEGTRDDDD